MTNFKQKIILKLIFYLTIYFLIILFLYSTPLQTKTIDFIEQISFKIFNDDIINENGSIEIYFCKEIDCAYFLNYYLNISIKNNLTNSKEIKCAFYDLNEKSIIRKLNEKNISTKLFEKNYEPDMAENIQPVGSKGLMHNKFCFNENSVLTGSWNPTERGTEKNNNYVIFVNSKNIAKNYALAYDSLEQKQRAKPLKINLSGIIIENYFCPAHNCENEIIKELKKSKKEIKILAFSFTSKNIADILVKKQQKENISIEVLFEKTRISSYSQLEFLKNNSIKYYFDNNPYTMHEKVIIIDGKTTVLGSYNPTKAANEINDENVLIIHNEKIAKLFLKEFEKLKFIDIN